MVESIALEQFLTTLQELLKAWYYIFFPAVIILFIYINKKLKAINKKLLLVSNYMIENIIDEGKSPKDYTCDSQEFAWKKDEERFEKPEG